MKVAIAGTVIAGLVATNVISPICSYIGSSGAVPALSFPSRGIGRRFAPQH